MTTSPRKASSLFLAAMASVLILSLSSRSHASVFNVAAGKPVTLVGTFGIYSASSPGTDAYPLPPAGSLVDNTFVPEGTFWRSGTIWWNERNAQSKGNKVVIDLQGTFVISGLIVQCDCNETYHVEGRNDAGAWVALADVPVEASWGLATCRPLPVTRPVPVNALRFSALSGDDYNSVSEIQAWGNPRIAGDITGDSQVNVFDLQRLASAWGQALGMPGYQVTCDLTGDDRVNVFDLQILAKNWNR